MLTKVMVTGTRNPDTNTERLVEFAINWLASSPLTTNSTLLLQGGAAGVDKVAKDFWNLYHLEDKEFEALWNEYGKAAGGKRNQEMVDFEPEICIAFPGPSSKGTWDAVRRAKKASIPTFILVDQDSMYKLYYYALLKPGEFLD